MISMIDLQTLTISYGKKVLVDSVNAEFAPGTVYGLVAPDGHGKTTLLRAMAGLPGASFWMRCRVRVRERSVL